MHPGDRLELTATGIDDTGAGTGDVGGCEVHATGLLPGERGRIEITGASRHHQRAWGILRERLGPASPDRARPACPAFGRCGGCVWQHLAYPAQLEHKRGRLVAAFEAAGLQVDIAPVVPAPAELGYRNKGKYVAARDRTGLVLGAYQPRTHQVVDTLGCRVVEPAIDRIARATRAMLEEAGLEVYDERRQRGQLRYVTIRTGADGRGLVTVVTTSKAARATLAGIAEVLAERGDVAGVAWLRNDSTAGAIAAGAWEPLAGDPVTREHLAGVEVELGPLAFAQINRVQAAALYEAVAEAAAGARDAIELYCGAGGIAFALARRGIQVLGIESEPEAIAAARAAAQRAGLDARARFEVADAAALPHLADHTPDLLVVDPPRKGLAPAVRQAIAALGAPGLLYVSCGPESLARDLSALAGDYVVERVQPFDLMPGTAQVEALAVCRRRPPAPAPPASR